MLIMIGSTLAGLFGKGVTEKAARLIGIGTLIFAAVAAFLIWLAIHDSNVADDALDEQDAQINAAVIEADRYAGNQMEARDRDFANSQGEIGNAIGNATAADPAKGKRPVGPASQSYYDELRRQQREKNR
jgi:creatinine amidohydrolase/Fe(II)-dependent formamide hydrolase-like protein